MKSFRILVLLAVLYCGMLAKAEKETFFTYNNNGLGCNMENHKIPDDYIVTLGIGAHKLHLSKKTWNEARNTCIKEGAHLAVIRSEEEAALIREWESEANIIDAWLGIHDHFQKDDWVTVQEVPLTEVGFTRWMEGEPNNNLGVERCVTYVRRGEGMNDLNCTYTRCFVCKIHLD